MVVSGKRLLFWAVSVVLILMVPLVAMQLTTEVNWDILDFAVMGTGLMSVGLVYELIVRKSPKRTYRVAFGLAIVAVFLLFWVNSAVGIIGHAFQEPNFMYMAVIGIVVTGALWSRFRSRGMATTLFVAAIAQMLVPVVALLIWPPPEVSWTPGILGIFILTAFFAYLMVISAILFQRAANS